MLILWLEMLETILGVIYSMLREMTGLDPWCCLGSQVKKVLGEKLADLPEQDEWRLPYLGKLLEQRGDLYYQLEDTSELTELIDSWCLN